MRPVGHAANGCARAEILRLREQRELGDETTIASAVKPNALRADVEFFRQVFRCIDLVLKIAPAHVAIDGRSPVAAVAFRRAVVEIENDIALRREVLIEHVLARVLRPEIADVVQVTCTVDEDHRGAVGLRAHVLRPIYVSGNVHSVARRNHHDLRHDPVERQPLPARTDGELRFSRSGPVLHQKEIRRAIDI